MIAVPSLAPLLQRFFTQRLMQQRQVSPHTINSYRDTFRQFLKFTRERLHKPPSALTFDEIDAPLVVTFLDHLEKHQGCSMLSTEAPVGQGIEPSEGGGVSILTEGAGSVTA